MSTTKRIKKIQARLRRKKIDAILISQPHNRRYLSGYTATDHDIGESSGSLLIPARKNPLLLTDFRFQIQAERETKEMRVLLYPKGLQALLKELLPDLGISSLAFESHYTLHNVAEKLQTMCSKLSISLHPTYGIVEKMRTIKNKKEIEKTRSSVLLNEQVFQTVYKTIVPGQTEIDIALALESTMRRRSAEAPSFESIVATGERSALPHAVPGPVKIEKHKPLMIDMGLILDGYCSDMTRTFTLGKASKKYLEIHRLVRKAQLAGIQKIRAGVTAAAVDKAARRVISDAGYGKFFGHALGHGVGLAVHEEPRLSSRNRKQLKAGMIVTVEPGIYLPGWGGIRLENMVVVREDGCEILNNDTTWLDI
ncbi:Xaa-Pro aminopeptidase [Desulfocapsa sulfexigens DSM 10523]|uniref:Xaa-Pro aminopeptidase n=1 Tax=Desulfocapsa sulfexigens (strain DSM 10523 / SB164P1) TaxID=1167006 RepID=M1P8U1_DESSD|nr:Xaa-Pro peptidase family protein [Desulfocapsa sulfexigens]AGF78067.1 Xaa-Pro aminopeptidase [Desulfocapsa sulfexigens DSM 10523]